MKRGLSLVTSLMMTASVFGGAASQAMTNNSTIAVVSAAEAKPVIGIGDQAYGGTTYVSAGAKKVSIPVRVTSTDLLAMVVELEVKADKAGAANPVITGISEKYAEILPNETASNVRSFTWTNKGLKAPELKEEVMANVEIELPADAAAGSSYTLTVKSLDASDLAKSEGYAFDEKGSDLTEKIVVGAKQADDYTLKFAENADGSWKAADKITVEPGQTVPVGLEIQSKTNTIGAVVFDFDLTKGATVKDYENGKVGEVEASESDILNAVWTIPGTFKGYDFKDETHLFTVNVTIPADAKNGSVYTLSIAGEDTSTGTRDAISPVKLPSIDLVVGETEVEESTIELTIDTVKVPYGTKTADVPVLVKNGDATAVVALFEAKNNAKVVGAKEAGVPGEVLANSAGNMVTWTNEFKGKVTDYKFGAEDTKLFILTVELPEGAKGEYPVVFDEKSVDISNAAQKNVKPVLKNGAVIVEEPAETTPAETTPAVTTTPAETTAPAVTTTPEVTTTPAETTKASVSIDIKVPEDDFKVVVEALDAIFDNENYKPEFYYEHEESFSRKNEVAAEVKVPVQVPSKDDASKAEKIEVVVKLSEKDFGDPDKKFTPGSVYDETKFYYTVPVPFLGKNVADTAIATDDAKVKEAVKNFLAGLDTTVPMPVMIGQLGDFDLNHSANQVDANGVLKMVLHLDAGEKTSDVVSDIVLADSDAAKKELAAHKNVDINEFALFLGNADLSEKSGNYNIAVNQIDANTILKAILQRDAIDGTLKRIPVKAWELAGTEFKK